MNSRDKNTGTGAKRFFRDAAVVTVGIFFFVVLSTVLRLVLM